MVKIIHGIDYSKITELIYIGTNKCCQIHFEKELLAKGIRADISLEEERLDDPLGVNFFLWLPTKDHTPPKMDQLRLGVETLRYFMQNTIPCYVHCKNGHGRSPTLVAAFLMQIHSLSAEDAITRIRSARPSIHLEPSQISILQTFGLDRR